jgi:hypothetical protein
LELQKKMKKKEMKKNEIKEILSNEIHHRSEVEYKKYSSFLERQKNIEKETVFIYF